jgi:hypothetical protein
MAVSGPGAGLGLVTLGLETDVETGGGAEQPAPPTWTAAPTPGDGQVTLHLTTPNPTDVVYARFRRFLPTATWSAESEALKRVGSGDLVVPGLTNEQGYGLTVYIRSGELTSEWLEPRYCMPTDGSAAEIDRIMDAVAGQLTALGLTDAGGDPVVATKEIPPDFDEVNTSCFKVFPDDDDAEANRSQVNEVRYRVNVAFCERSKTTLQRAAEMLIRQQVRDQFLGKRLVALPEAACEKETNSGVVDLEVLWERFQWVSVLTFEFVTLRSRG